MLELITFFIGIGLVVYFTFEFYISLKAKKEPLIKKLWKWIKDVFDAITGIG